MGSMNSIRVQVDDNDASAARAILAQNAPPATTAPGDANSEMHLPSAARPAQR